MPNNAVTTQMWRMYHIANGIRTCIAEFQYIFDAYNWLKERCQEKHDGFYFNDQRVICEH